MHSLARNSIAFLFSTFLAFAVSAYADDDSIKEQTNTTHLYDNVDLVSKVDFQYAKPRIVAKAVYPQLVGNGDDENGNADLEHFNQIVLDIIAQQIDDFKKQVAENQKTRPVLPPDVKFKNDLYIDFDASFIRSGKHPILSVRFSIQGYVAGMAHPYHYHQVLNYDLADATQLDLDDIFTPDSDYLPLISAYSKQTLLNRRLSNDTLIEHGTLSNASNFKNWNIKATGILITFDEDQVAPYIDGAQSVLIPYSALTDEIDQNSVVASCATHKRRCVSSNVVTGGFIDEAANSRLVDPRHRLLNPILSQR